jgi:hypothetical protein
MKTWEWVFVIGGISVFIFLTFKFGNNALTRPQLTYPRPGHSFEMRGASIHNVEFMPPELTYPDPKNPFLLHDISCCSLKCFL